MAALGQKQTSRHVRVMSVLPLKADIRQREWHVRYVPVADILAPTETRVSSPRESAILFEISSQER